MTATPLEPALVKIERACRYLDVGRTKLYRLIREGKLDCVRIGKSARIFVEAGPGAPVHRNRPPLFRSRPEQSGPLAAASNSQLVVAPRGKEALNAKLRPGCS